MIAPGLQRQRQNPGAGVDIPTHYRSPSFRFSLKYSTFRQVRSRHGDCNYSSVVFIDADVAGSRKIPNTDVVTRLVKQGDESARIAHRNRDRSERWPEARPPQP